MKHMICQTCKTEFPNTNITCPSCNNVIAQLQIPTPEQKKSPFANPTLVAASWLGICVFNFKTFPLESALINCMVAGIIALLIFNAANKASKK